VLFQASVSLLKKQITKNYSENGVNVKKEKTMRVITLRLSGETYQKAKQSAEQQSVTVSSLLRQLIEKEFGKTMQHDRLQSKEKGSQNMNC
jgi:hypothetical protein